MLLINSPYLAGNKKTKSQKLAPGVVVPFEKETVRRTPREHRVEMRLRYNPKIKTSQTYDIVINKFDEGNAASMESVMVGQDVTDADDKFLMV